MGTRDRARWAISPSYIPGDRIRWFPQSSLKLLPTHSSGEYLNIQFHSFLNLDHGGYLLLSQAFVFGAWRGGGGAFVFHLLRSRKMINKRAKYNEWGTSGVAWNPPKKHSSPAKLGRDACFSSQQLLQDLWSACWSDCCWKQLWPQYVSYSTL